MKFSTDEQEDDLADTDMPTPFPVPEAAPSLEQIQRWTHSIGRAQQILLEHAATNLSRTDVVADLAERVTHIKTPEPAIDFRRFGELQAELATQSMDLWQRFLRSGGQAPADAPPVRDGRFADPAWSSHPFFDLICHT